MAVLLLLFAIYLSVVSSLNNGLARRPALGWRSWNCYWFDINQTLIKNAMMGLLDKSRTVNGVPTSLAELGYNNGGIDDGWQHCDYYQHLFHNNSAPNGMYTFHIIYKICTQYNRNICTIIYIKQDGRY